MYCLRVGSGITVVLIELRSYMLRKGGSGTSIGERRKAMVVVTTEVKIYNNTEDQVEITLQGT
jgi:hypothetical protein